MRFLRIGLILSLISGACYAQQISEDFSSIPITRERAFDRKPINDYFHFTISELQELSEQGDVSASLTLAAKLLFERDSAQRERGFELLTSIADQGNVSARMLLSENLLRERDSNSRESGLNLLIPLARQGYIDAQSDLAREYWYGLTIERNQNLAILWYRQALRGGHSATAFVWSSHYKEESAMYKNDGTLLQPDIAILPDQVKALMWELVSNKLSSYHSDIGIQRFKLQLTDQEFANAEELAAQCLNSSFSECGWPSR